MLLNHETTEEKLARYINYSLYSYDIEEYLSKNEYDEENFSTFIKKLITENEYKNHRSLITLFLLDLAFDNIDFMRLSKLISMQIDKINTL